MSAPSFWAERATPTGSRTRSRAQGSTRSIPMPDARRFRCGQSLPTRIGGFGGAVGLPTTSGEQRITHVIDATHPFAAEMSRHAVEACAATGAPLIALERAPWIAVQPATTGSRCRTSTPRWLPCRSSARACFSRSAGSISRRSRPGRSTPIRCGLSMRPRTPCRCRDAEVIVSRGPFTLEGDLRTDALARHRMAGRPQLRRRRRAGQDRRGARARPARHHDRTPRPARTAAGGKRGRGAWRGSLMARASAHRPSGRRGASPNCRR